MKKNIHPTYYNDCVVTCACGNTFVTGSTRKEFRIDICSACHPFFTGEQRFVDTEGRVDKFIRKRSDAEAEKAKLTAIKEAKKRRQEAERSQVQPKSLRDLSSTDDSEISIETSHSASYSTNSSSNTDKKKQ